MKKNAINKNRLQSIYAALINSFTTHERPYLNLINEGLESLGMELGIIGQSADDGFQILAASPSTEDITTGMTFK